MKLHYLIISTALLLSRKIYHVPAQQSAAGQDTIIGIVGRDFIMMGADTSSSGGGGIALTSSNIDKLAVIHDGGGGNILNSLYGSDDDNMNNISKMQRRSVEQQAIVVGFAGDAADADRLAGTLKIHTQVREYEAGIGNDVICTFDGDLYDDDQMSSSSLSKSRAVLGTISPSGLDAESIAYFARKEIATRMRSRQPLQLCLLVGGMVRCASSANYSKTPSFHERVQKQVSAASSAYSLSVQSNTNNERKGDEYCNIEDSEKSMNTETSPMLLSPKLFWLDQYGSLQNLSYGCHGFGSNFALSALDQGFRMGMSRQEAECLIRECFEQLRQRYLINSPQPPRIKCIDAFGVREMK